MPPLLGKAVFPVRQAYVCAKKLLLHRWTRLLYCCQRLLSSSADIWDGDCAKLKDGAKFFFPVFINLADQYGMNKVSK